MLKSQVGYSMDKDSFASGTITAKIACKGFRNPQIGFLYTSVLSDIKEVVKGVKSVTNIPIIGCTSSSAIIVPEGIVASSNGFSGMMCFNDSKMKVSVASHEAGKDARSIGRKVALEAVKKAHDNRAPAYFYMIASPKEEEDYLMGIQDVIGRVPMFGGSAADDTVEGKWKIICDDKVFSDGVAVAFFYTDVDIDTIFTGCYNETKKRGIITKVDNKRTLVKIDGELSLNRYGAWIRKDPRDLKGINLLVASVKKPLGIKDPLGNLTVVRHPMIGNSDNTMNIGNNIVESTAIVLLEATTDELVNANGEVLKQLRKEVDNPAAYLLVHSSSRKLTIGRRLDEVHKQLVKEAKGVPFIVMFSYGEYGYRNNSANTCGSLMLSFTGFGQE